MELYQGPWRQLSSYATDIGMAQHVSPLPLGWVMPEKPEDYDTLPEKDKLRADKLYESALCYKYYEVLTAKKNPKHYTAISHNMTWKSPHIQPIQSIRGAWSSLLAVTDHWPELQSQDHCPISFSEEDRKMNDEEMENRDYIERLMEEFQDSGILPLDGIIDPEDYEILQKTNQMQKGNFHVISGE